MKQQCKKMSTAFRNKGIAITKKKCIDDNEKIVAAITKEYLKQVKSLQRRILITKSDTKLVK